MQAIWTSNIRDAKEKKDFEATLHNQLDGLVLSRLATILEQRLKTIEKLPRGLDDFDNPSWAYKEAYRLGYQSALQEVLNLLDKKD